MKKYFYFIQNVARNLKLKFGAIWMKNVKGPLRIINEKGHFILFKTLLNNVRG